MLVNGTSLGSITSILLSSAVLSACSSGSSDGTAEEGSNIGLNGTKWKSVSENEYYASRTGVWASEINFWLDVEVSTEYQGITITNSAKFNSSRVSVSSYSNPGFNTIWSDSCDIEGAELLLTEGDEELIVEAVNDIANCASTNVKYFRSSGSSNAYKMEIDCDGELVTSFLQSKLSEDPSFSHGSLSFSSDQVQVLNGSSEVCGAIANGVSDFEISPQPNPLNLDSYANYSSEIVIGAPYEGEKVIVELLFEGQLAAGTYSVGGYFQEEEGVFSASISSHAFDSYPLYTTKLYADAGSVTITTITPNSTSGSFVLSMTNGDNIEGNFSLALVP